MAALPKDLVRRAAARRHRADPICGRRFSMSDKKAPTPNQLRNSNRMKLGVFGTNGNGAAFTFHPDRFQCWRHLKVCAPDNRSEEHTSELKYLIRTQYAVI